MADFFSDFKREVKRFIGDNRGCISPLSCLIVGKIHCVVSGVRIRVLGRASVRCIPYLVATSGGGIHERNFGNIQEKFFTDRVANYWC